MIKKIYQLISVSMMITFSIGHSQTDTINKDSLIALNNDSLKGLIKVNLNDSNYNGLIHLFYSDDVTPVFNEEGIQTQKSDAMQLLISVKYTLIPYIDNLNKVKAFVIQRATEEEIEQKRTMNSAYKTKSDLIGKEAKSFSVKDLNENEYSLENLRGKIMVLNFWFTECKPCVMEMPELNELVEKYKDKNVVFLGFARNEKSKIVSFLKNQKFNYNIIPNSSEVIAKYNINGFPTNIIIDQNLKIQYSETGLGQDTIYDLDKTIELLLK